MELSLRWARSNARIPARPSPAAHEVEELRRRGLGMIARPILDFPQEGSQVWIYCLDCGTQVDPSRRARDPEWWRCARGCNEPSSDSSDGAQ